MQYKSKEVRDLFIKFYQTKLHAQINSSNLVPKEDPTVLFNTAGMQPLVPYLTGKMDHLQGNRLVNSQKCIRTGDIDEVGDNRHCTFFEMLGTWSIGDYFKKESIEWGFEFLTSKNWLGLDPQRLFVTVYKGGGENVKMDEEAIKTWKNCFKNVGVEADFGQEYDFKNGKGDKFLYRITAKSGKDNWWGLPYRGPCGPCSEIYYLLNNHETQNIVEKINQMEKEEAEMFLENEIVEIWNHVFMQYEGEKTENSEPKDLKDLAKNNIDTGMGFERLLMVINGLDTVYKTDVLNPIVKVVEKWQK